MAFDTPFLPENTPRHLIDFSFHKIQRQTKAAIVNMLENFFDAYNKEYAIQIPELMEIQNYPSNTKLFIERDFPYQERKIPIVIVSIKSAKERKMYLGADNYIGHKIIETSTGKKAAMPMYTGAGDISVSMIIATNSAEDRARLVEMVTMCFTHYFRWQYFYTYGDGNKFSIVPNTDELDFGAENEIQDDSSSMTYIYTTEINMKSFIEYTYCRPETDVVALGDYEIDEASGPGSH